MSRSALRNRAFLVYLLGSTISLHGLWIYRVALGWYAWQLTHSELWIGIISFTQFAPAVFFGPLFGVLADRFNPRHASMLINSLNGTSMLVLATLTWSGQMDIGLLCLFSIATGSLDGAHTPVRMTLVPRIVTKDQLQSAIASNSIAFNLSRFVGPAIAGLVIATLGIGAAFFINGLSYIAIVAAVATLKTVANNRRRETRASVLAEMRVGIQYTLTHPTIRGLLLIVALASVFGRGVLEMLPAFADTVFARGSSGLAALTAAMGAGAITTGLVLSRHPSWLNFEAIRLSIVAAGGLVVVFSTIDHFWLGIALSSLLGVTLSLCGVGSQILIQTRVDEEVRGRVSSLWGMIAFGGTAIGGLVIGTTAASVGLQETVLMAGLVSGTSALFAIKNPAKVRKEGA